MKERANYDQLSDNNYEESPEVSNARLCYLFEEFAVRHLKHTVTTRWIIHLSWIKKLWVNDIWGNGGLFWCTKNHLLTPKVISCYVHSCLTTNLYFKYTLHAMLTNLNICVIRNDTEIRCKNSELKIPGCSSFYCYLFKQ